MKMNQQNIMANICTIVINFLNSVVYRLTGANRHFLGPWIIANFVPKFDLKKFIKISN